MRPETAIPDRSEFLAAACEGDDGLKHQVQSLLDQDSSDGSNLLDHPAAEWLAESGVIQLAPGKSLGQYRIGQRIGQGVWARCTRPPTRSWAGKWR